VKAHLYLPAAGSLSSIVCLCHFLSPWRSRRVNPAATGLYPYNTFPKRAVCLQTNASPELGLKLGEAQTQCQHRKWIAERLVRVNDVAQLMDD